MKILTYIILISIFLCGGSFYSQWNQELIWRGTEEKKNVAIPESAIRLRILANSDDLRDQWLKRKVRDEMIKEIKKWKQPANINEARKRIVQKLPEFKRISEQTVARYGYKHPIKIDFGKVPFPTKLYGEQVYPAGNYEALRIIIGEGKGDNWWCVLFPPLCFIDMSNGDAIEEESSSPVLSASLTSQKHSSNSVQEKKPVQVRFLLLDKGLDLIKNGF